MVFWFLVFLGILSLSGTIYQAAAEVRDRRAYPPPGQMVSVGDRRLHLIVSGESHGTPTVILESGVAGFSRNWFWVQEELSQITRVVSYDRAGLGWSDPAPGAFDAYQSARDLHTALENVGVMGPYVVAAHSYGGLVGRAFIDLYPDEVIGLILVDASHPDQWARFPASGGGRMVAASNQLMGILARLGIVRIFNMTAGEAAGLPERQSAEVKAIMTRFQPWIASGDVIAVWNTKTRDRINQAQSLNGLPLIVLSATERPDYGKEEMNAQQADLASLSSNHLHQWVEGASHESLLGEQKYALVVAKAIEMVLIATQSGEVLSSTSIQYQP